VPDMTPEEHKRRGDAADALFREMKRQIAEKLGEGDELRERGSRGGSGADPPPTGQEALDEPFSAFPRGICGSPATAAARTE
jgi:hypothetical protein